MTLEQPRVVGVDVGGTFTDCVAMTDGRISVAKVSTTVPQSDGVLTAVDQLAGGNRFDRLVHGSTVATNALLERRGARTVLVTDAGFEDVIEIGRQDRPSLYDSFADRPEPLVPRALRVGMGSGPLVDRVATLDPEAVAISLAYSFADPSEEQAVAAALAGLGVDVSLSSRVAAEFREFERTSTTVLNAYLSPAVGRYLRSLAEESRRVAGRIEVMRSSGGLMEIAEASDLPAALLLSGPAGGVVAATELARAHGYGRAVTFDMGGTSTDVCRIENGRPEVSYERSVGGFPCRMPSLAVHTVGAGGGSVAWVDPGGSLRVGPQSAGSRPGPAAYGRGGTSATVTDAHVLLGRLDAGAKLGGTLGLDKAAAAAALSEVGRAVGLDPVEVAAGVIEVVEAHMGRAIRAVSVEEGADPRQATLVAFGGAGGLHASSLARSLAMSRVAIPPHAGVFSALGMLLAPPRHDGARTVLLAVHRAAEFPARLAEVAEAVEDRYSAVQGGRPGRTETVVDVRYVGQAHELSVPAHPGETFEDVARRFHQTHQAANGFARPEDPVEIVTLRAAAVGEPVLSWADLPTVAGGRPPEPRVGLVAVDGNPTEVDIWWRPDLPAGMTIAGPAVVAEDVGTTLLLVGDTAEVLADGTIEVTW